MSEDKKVIGRIPFTSQGEEPDCLINIYEGETANEAMSNAIDRFLKEREREGKKEGDVELHWFLCCAYEDIHRWHEEMGELKTKMSRHIDELRRKIEKELGYEKCPQAPTGKTSSSY